MTNSERDRLASLGPQRLAEALLRLAARDDDAAHVVERLSTPTQERVKRARRALAGLKRRRSFVPYHRSRQMRDKLLGALEDIAACEADPKEVVDLVARFYECDAAILGHADDSGGMIGDVFRIDARLLWNEWAARIDDSDWLVERSLALLESDEQGVRDSILRDASAWLDPESLRSLADQLWERGLREKFRAHAEDAKEEPSFRRPHSMILAQSVARALGDPDLHERAVREWCGGEVGGLAFDIAQEYVEAARYDEALAWLDRLEARGTDFRAHERRQLLRRIHVERGETEQLVALVREDLHRSPTADDLERLVALVGEDHRADLQREAVQIAATGAFRASRIAFLCDVGEFDVAECVIVDRRGEIDGDGYSTLVPLLERFVEAERPLAATIVARALLESILRRAVTRSYGHAARYWLDLADHARGIVRWGDVTPHGAYAESIEEKHRRKSSFWARVDKERAKRQARAAKR